MTAQPASAGSALWFLGNPTSAGMHLRTMAFTANKPGNYRYLCAVRVTPATRVTATTEPAAAFTS